MTSNRLSSNNAQKLTELHEQLRSCYTSNATVTFMANVANIFGLFEQIKCIRSHLDSFTHYQYFYFSRGTNQFSCCKAKYQATAERKWYEPCQKLFLNHVSIITDMPHSNLICPGEKMRV